MSLFLKLLAVFTLVLCGALRAQESNTRELKPQENCFLGEGLLLDALGRGYQIGAEAIITAQEYDHARVYYLYASAREEKTWGVIASFSVDQKTTQCVLIGGTMWVPVRAEYDVSRDLDREPLRKTTKRCAPLSQILQDLQDVGEVPVGRGMIAPGVDEMLTLADNGSWTSLQITQNKGGEAGCINSWGTDMRLTSSFLPLAKAE